LRGFRICAKIKMYINSPILHLLTRGPILGAGSDPNEGRRRTGGCKVDPA
jgi:hypothetical protein